LKVINTHTNGGIKMTETKKVVITSKIVAYDKENGNVFNHFTSLEEGLKWKEERQYPTSSIGTGFFLRTENDEIIDDAKGCYSSEEDALNHLKEIAFSHSSEPTDTEGHSYDCQHCGIHYYIYGGEEIPDCTVIKVI
jgi:hypothetical protein